MVRHVRRSGKHRTPRPAKKQKTEAAATAASPQFSAPSTSNGLSGFVGMSRTEFRYMLESLVGGAVDGVRAEMVAAQAALKEEIQTALAPVQTTHSLCLLSV